MKASFTLAALFAAGSYAQLSNLPQCALNCFLGPLQSDGCDSLTDFKCHCSNPTLIPKVQPCVQSKCSASEQETVISAVQSLCESVGVTLTISQPGSPATTTSAEETTSAPAYTTTSAVSSIITSQYTPPPYGGNTTATGTVPTGLPTSTPAPTGAAATAGVGGLVVLAAGAVAALAGF